MEQECYNYLNNWGSGERKPGSDDVSWYTSDYAKKPDKSIAKLDPYEGAPDPPRPAKQSKKGVFPWSCTHAKR